MASFADELARAKDFHRAGRLNDAEQVYRGLLRVAADNAELHYLLGAVLAASNKDHQAIASLTQAVGLLSDYAQAHHLLGALWAQQGDLDRAVESLRQCAAVKSTVGRGRR